MRALLIPMVLLSFACQGQTADKKPRTATEKYMAAHPDNGKPSIAKGTVGNGSLENGKLMPFKGPNFEYFDTGSYLKDRAFVHHKVKKTLLATYAELAEEVPERKFNIMECSNEEGGKLWPHRTHQNGLSVDLMMPKIKKGEPYVGLDGLGKSHYLLKFDDDGRFAADPAITIDFNLVAQHILLLDKNARINGLRVKKVIIKTDLKDDLYATTWGKKLKASGIYLVRQLTPMINNLHDDHYHIDFELL